MSEAQPPDGAAAALRAFNSAEYEECTRLLGKLETTDRRVAYNLAVAEYYKGGERNSSLLRERVWRACGATWPRTDTLPDPSAEPALHYTCALLLYRARHHAEARRTLERLVAVLDRIEDPVLARNVPLLLVEVYLCCRMPDEAIALSERVRGRLPRRPPECLDLLKRLTLRAHLMNGRRTTPPSEAQTVEWLFLRAHQQYVNGDLRGAADTLGQYGRFRDRSSPNVDDVWAALNNNLGVVYSAMSKRHMSVKYMQQALREHLKFSAENGSEADAAGDRPLYVFNLGVSLLKSGRADDAFECLVEAGRHFPNDPRIWYRLAECCVAHREKGDRRENIVRKVGSSAHAKLIPGSDRDEYAISGESYAIPTLTLEFAALCLTNALILLPFRERAADFTFRSGPSGSMNYAQYSDLRNSALLLYGYVSLKLDDPATTLEHCAALLSQCSAPGRCALARLYSAEALVSLDRITEAAEHLSPAVVRAFTSKLSPASQDVVGFAVRLNSAVCHATRGDLATSRSILQQINSPCALPLQLYLEMCAGNIDNCRVLLRKFTRVPSQ